MPVYRTKERIEGIENARKEANRLKASGNTEVRVIKHSESGMRGMYYVLYKEKSTRPMKTRKSPKRKYQRSKSRKQKDDFVGDFGKDLF